MIIHFSIHYRTDFGQNLYILGSLPELGGWDISKAVPMKFNETFFWTKDLKITSFQERILRYRYFIRSDDGSSIYEVGKERILGLNSGSKTITLNDQWQGNNSATPFLSAPFTEIFYNQSKAEITQLHTYSKELIIRATALTVEKGSEIAICGNCSYLGNWDPAKAPAMKPVYGSKWEIHIPSDRIAPEIEYKFIRRKCDGDAVIWENSENHSLKIPTLEQHETFSVEHSYTDLPLRKPKFFGTVVPVFSLRSERSCGIGDFLDLEPLADWIAATGQKIIQVLPVNDTTATGTWTDSYPYDCISVNALHPIYISIPGIGPIRDEKAGLRYEQQRERLNRLERVDYEEVLRLKMEFIQIQFDTYSQDTFSEPKFLSFYKNNKKWLLPYCAFCTFRDRYKTSDFSKWGKNAVCTPELIKKINTKGTPTYSRMSFYLFTQYHLHLQLTEAVKYMHGKGIAFKGDIPIGVAGSGADVWSEPYLFDTESQVGAPPDEFSPEGQNWGFPSFNWDLMENRQYRWWKDRLRNLSAYFDAYRIDHILGFFRIWEIPSSQLSAKLGYFNPSLPFTCEELSGFGFRFDYRRDAVPHIRFDCLKEIFGAEAERISARYLDRLSHDSFTLKEEFSTQRKIEEHFQGKDEAVRKGLCRLVEEVLFLEDRKAPGKFYPRILAQQTHAYGKLSESDRNAFDRLYRHFFYERNNELWKASAYKKLPEIIGCTNMLSCGEDLGMIPSCVPEVMSNLKIFSLEVQRMPKQTGIRFADPAAYPYRSVCTTGTHDLPTLRGWWEEDRERAQAFYNDFLGMNGEAPRDCGPDLCTAILQRQVSGSSMLVILPLQDWLSVDLKTRAEDPSSERINDPSDPHHYWRYRMNVTLESLNSDSGFKEKIKNLIHQ